MIFQGLWTEQIFLVYITSLSIRNKTLSTKKASGGVQVSKIIFEFLFTFKGYLRHTRNYLIGYCRHLIFKTVVHENMISNCDRNCPYNVRELKIKPVLLLNIVSRGENTICNTKKITPTWSVYQNMSYNIAKYHFWNMTKAVSALRTSRRGREKRKRKKRLMGSWQSFRPANDFLRISPHLNNLRTSSQDSRRSWKYLTF